MRRRPFSVFCFFYVGSAPCALLFFLVQYLLASSSSFFFKKKSGPGGRSHRSIRVPAGLPTARRPTTTRNILSNSQHGPSYRSSGGDWSSYYEWIHSSSFLLLCFSRTGRGPCSADSKSRLSQSPATAPVQEEHILRAYPSSALPARQIRWHSLLISPLIV